MPKRGSTEPTIFWRLSTHSLTKLTLLSAAILISFWISCSSAELIFQYATVQNTTDKAVSTSSTKTIKRVRSVMIGASPVVI